MESGHFNGHANEDFYWGIWPFKINPKDYPNKMINVDFSKAEIKDFAFINSLDLSKVTFPDSENLLIIKDYRNLIAQLEIEINKMRNNELSKQILNTYFKHSCFMGQDINVFNVDENEFLDYETNKVYFKIFEMMGNIRKS
jgi:hypothetical protein